MISELSDTTKLIIAVGMYQKARERAEMLRRDGNNSWDNIENAALNQLVSQLGETLGVPEDVCRELTINHIDQLAEMAYGGSDN